MYCRLLILRITTCELYSKSYNLLQVTWRVVRQNVVGNRLICQPTINFHTKKNLLEFLNRLELCQHISLVSWRKFKLHVLSIYLSLFQSILEINIMCQIFSFDLILHVIVFILIKNFFMFFILKRY